MLYFRFRSHVYHENFAVKVKIVSEKRFVVFFLNLIHFYFNLLKINDVVHLLIDGIM